MVVRDIHAHATQMKRSRTQEQHTTCRLQLMIVSDSLHMERNSYLLFKDQDEPFPVMLDYMLTQVRDSIVPRMKHELDSLDWDFSSPKDKNKTPRLNDHVRDNLVQIGALFM